MEATRLSHKYKFSIQKTFLGTNALAYFTLQSLTNKNVFCSNRPQDAKPERELRLFYSGENHVKLFVFIADATAGKKLERWARIV